MMPALFKPSRASPQPRPVRINHIPPAKPPAPPSIDLSVVSTSTVVVPELRNLSLNDIDFIESVVQRAGHFATTFPAVFKAYNDILKERGMDTGEVRYYGKLLKLGTMKGKNWGEKWGAVKRQLPQEEELPNDEHETVSTRAKPHLMPTHLQPLPSLPVLRDIDAGTITSEIEDGDISAGNLQYHQTSNLFSTKECFNARKTPRTLDEHPKATMVSSLRGIPSVFRDRLPISDTSESEAETIAPTRPATSDGFISKYSQNTQTPQPSKPASTNSSTLSRPATSRNRFSGLRKSVIQSRNQEVTDDNDVWNKIRIQQLEAESDSFRNERLLERCWEVWRESYHWITASQEQIDQARHTFLLKLTFHHWRSALASHRSIYQDVAVLDNERRLCAFLMLWRRRLREKQQAKWRSDMRSRMKIIKDRQNTRILKEAWTLWCQKCQLAFADQRYRMKVVLTAFLKWKELSDRINGIGERAKRLVSLRSERLLTKCWKNWRFMTGISGAEKELVRRVYARIVWQAWSAWREHTYDYRRATFFRDRNIQKRVLKKWQGGVEKVHALGVRADKHSARQSKILVCAVLRVWLALVRGREVDRQRHRKLLYRAFMSWKNKVVQHRHRDERATILYQRTDLRVVRAAFTRWRALYQLHDVTHHTAIYFYDARLVKNFGTFWLMRLREGIEERKRQKLVKKLQDRQAARVLYRWLLLTRKQRRCTQTEALVQEQVRRRMGQKALSHWTQRVIFMREREFSAIEIYNVKVVRRAWTGVQSIYARHGENSKLLEDHLTFKKEDTLRRFFRRWLATTRVTQHRRYILQSREDKIKQMILQKVWDQWRSNYLERRLRPLEIEMLMRSQQNLMYQAFSVWHAKARARPAIVAVKFNARRTKKKFYLEWRQALPIAQTVRKVREKHDSLLLYIARVFKEWLEAYRAKLVLKAVARARYLQLPTNRARIIRSSVPSPSTPSSSASAPHESTPTELYPIRSGGYVPRHTTMQVPSDKEPITNNKEALHDDDPASTGVQQRPIRLSRSPFGLGQGTGIVSLLRTNVHQNQQGKSDLSPPRPRFAFSSTQSRRGSSVNGIDNGDVVKLSLFTSVNGESTPPDRRKGSTASDDAGGRRALWNRFSTGRRIREHSPSVTSQLTESPPSSP